METKEKELLEEIINGNDQAVLELQHFCVLNGRNFVADRIKKAIEKNIGSNLRDFVIRYIYSVCPKCASDDTEVVDFSESFRDGSLICSHCRCYIRLYDAG
jgi:hypothetical protein